MSSPSRPEPLMHLPPIPRGIGMFVVLLTGLVLISAMAGVGAALVRSPMIWFMAGFEAVVLLASVFGVMIGLGRHATGPALGLTCVGGAIGAASFLGYIAGQSNFRNLDLQPFMIARLVASAGILIAAALIVLLRRPGASGPRLIAGLACAAGLAALAAAVWMFGGRVLAIGTLAGAIAGLGVGVTGLALLAAAVHLIVSAFETGSLDDSAPVAPPAE